MVKTTLVGPDLVLGQEILRVLDNAEFPIAAAFWLLQQERGDWNLFRLAACGRSVRSANSGTGNEIPQRKVHENRLILHAEFRRLSPN